MMDEVIYIDGLPVNVKYSGDEVRLSFDALTVEQIERVMKCITKVTEGMKTIAVEDMTIYDLVEMTFDDVLIQKK